MLWIRKLGKQSDPSAKSLLDWNSSKVYFIPSITDNTFRLNYQKPSINGNYGVWDSAVGVTTRYGLDGPEIESQKGRIFRTGPDRPPGPLSLLYNGYRVIPGG
jgi:hypothetical protein